MCGIVSSGSFANALSIAQHGFTFSAGQMHIVQICFSPLKSVLLNRPCVEHRATAVHQQPVIVCTAEISSAMNHRRGYIQRNSFHKFSLALRLLAFAVVNRIQTLTRLFVRHVLIWPILQLRWTSPTRLDSLDLET